MLVSSTIYVGHLFWLAYIAAVSVEQKGKTDTSIIARTSGFHRLRDATYMFFDGAGIQLGDAGDFLEGSIFLV